MKRLLFACIVIVFLAAGSIGALLLWRQVPGPVLNIPASETIIDLRSKGITSLPAEIGEYTQATQLFVDNNNLTGTLPAEIRKMRNLEILSAKDNQLTGIPAEIGQLRNLKKIDFSGNNISTYPNELLQLQQSVILDLTGNPFTVEQIDKLRTDMPNASIRF